MDHNNFPEQQDPTTRLINDIILTMGGEAVGVASSDPAAQHNEQHESPASPPPTFNQVLDGMRPGASGDMSVVQQLVRERLPEILGSLRTLPRLPSPTEVAAIATEHGSEPIVIDGAVTVGELAGYLHVEGGTDREVGLQIYGDTTVLIPGGDHDVTPPYAWQFVEDEAAAIAHTHPDNPIPVDNHAINMDHYHYPSIDDLNLARYSNAANIIFSAEGIVLYPNAHDLRHMPSWREHARTLPWPNTGDPYQDYAITRREKDKYLNEVVGVQTIPWDALPPEATLQEAINYALLQQQERGNKG